MNKKLELAIQLFLFLVIVFGIIYISHGLLDNPHGFFSDKSKPTKKSTKSFSDIFKNSCNSGLTIGGGGNGGRGSCSDKEEGAGCECSDHVIEEDNGGDIEEGFTGYGETCNLRSGDNTNCWKNITPNMIRDKPRCSLESDREEGRNCSTYDGLEFYKKPLGIGGNFYTYENETENIKSLLYTYPDGRGVMYKTPYYADMKEFAGTIYRDNIDNPSTAEIMKHQLSNFNSYDFDVKGSAVGIMIHYSRTNSSGRDVGIDKNSWNVRLQTSDSNHPNGFEADINRITVNDSNKTVAVNFNKPDNVHVIGLLLKYRDDNDSTPILIRSIRTTSAEGKMLLDHPYQFYLVPTSNCRTQTTLEEVGIGHCTGGEEIKTGNFQSTRAWKYGNRLRGADRTLASDKYKNWRDKAWADCKKEGGTHVSVWFDAGARCYKGKCTPNNNRNVKTWTERGPQDGVFQNPWNLTQRVCNSDRYDIYDKYFGIPFNTLWVLGYTNNVIPYQYRPTVVLNLIVVVGENATIKVPTVSFGVRHFESDEYHSDFEITVKEIDLHKRKGTSVVIPLAINLTPYKGKNIFPDGFCIGGFDANNTDEYSLYIERVYGNGVSNRFKLEKGEKVTQNEEGFIRYNYTIGDLSDAEEGQHKILTVNNCGELTDSNAKISCLLNTANTWIPSEIQNGYTTGHLTSRRTSDKNAPYHMYRYNLAFPINNLDPSNLQEMSIDKNSKCTLTMWLNVTSRASNIVFPSFSISRNNVLVGDKQLQCPNNRWFFLVININGKSSYARLQDGVTDSDVRFESASLSSNIGNLPQADMVFDKGYISHFRRLENISASENVINKLKGEFFNISPGVIFNQNIKTLQARCTFIIDVASFDSRLDIGHRRQGGFINLMKNTKTIINANNQSETIGDTIDVSVDDTLILNKGEKMGIRYNENQLSKIVVVRDLHWCRIYTLMAVVKEYTFTEVYSGDNHYWIPDTLSCSDRDAVTFYHTSIPIQEDVLKRVLDLEANSNFNIRYLSEIHCCGNETGGDIKPRYKNGTSSLNIDEHDLQAWNITNFNT